MRRTALMPFFLATVTLGACALDEPTPPSHTITDSAGVVIVHSHRPRWTEAEAWTVASEPFLKIGAVDGDEPYLLDRVMGVARLADGRVAVAMMGDNTIRFYDEAGVYVDRVGGTGEGPEEFSQIMSLHRVGETLYGNQFSTRPLRIFSGETMEFMGSLTPPTIEGFVGSGVRDLFGDGSMLFQDWPQGHPVEQGVYVQTSTVVRATSEGRVDIIGVFPSVTYVGIQGRIAYPQEYGPILQTAPGRDLLYAGFPDDYDIAVWSLDGTLVRRIRRHWDPVPVTEAHRERMRDKLLNLGMEGGGEIPPRLRQQRLDIFEGMIFPEHHPAHGMLHVDREGNLWVERTKPDWSPPVEWNPVDPNPTPWDVFDPEGIWLGVVDLPARFRMKEIGDDYVAGLRKNEMGVEFVQLHELNKPGG